MRTLPAPTLSPQHLKRFWSRVTKTDTCWLWSTQGAGYLSIDGKSYRATAISYMIHTGSYPEMYLCHHCDNPRCVNPEHLFEGSAKDNSQDMVRKMRHGNMRLSPQKAFTIRSLHRNDGMSTQDLSMMFGVSINCIRDVLNNKTWVDAA